MSTTKQTMTCPKCGAEIMSWQVRCRNCGKIQDKYAEKYASGEIQDKYAEKHVSAPDRRGLLWWIASTVCLVFAGLYTLAVLLSFGWAIQREGLTVVLVFGVIPVLILFGSIALAWKWELISGVVLIAVYLFLIILDLIAKQYYSDTRFYLPLLVAGIIFILSWFLHWRPQWLRRIGKKLKEVSSKLRFTTLT